MANIISSLIDTISGSKEISKLNIASGISDVLGSVFNTPQDKQKLIDSQNAINSIIQKEIDSHTETILNAQISDTKDARDMQRSAMSQTDIFTKRFTYYVAAFSIFFSFAFFVLLMFITVPEKNLGLVQTFAGILIGTCVVSVYNFLYGSTTGSKDKDKTISDLTKNP